MHGFIGRVAQIYITDSQGRPRRTDMFLNGRDMLSGLRFTAHPQINGEPLIGQTLTVSADAEGAALSYQWIRDGAVISGATAARYEVVPADDLCQIGVLVTAAVGEDGISAAVSAGVARWPAPVAIGSIGNRSYMVGQTVPATDLRTKFRGGALNYTIMPDDGQLLIDGHNLIFATEAAYSGSFVITASNSGGEAILPAFSVTIEAVHHSDPDPPNDLLSTSEGAISNVVERQDGANSFTLIGTEHAGDYSVFATDIASGHPIVLVPPTVGESPAGTFRISKFGFYVYPSDAPAVATHAWLVDNLEVATGTEFVSENTHAFGQIELELRVSNINSMVSGTTIATRVTAQEPQMFTAAPSVFRKSDSSRVHFAEQAIPIDPVNELILAGRIKYEPHTGESRVAGLAFRLADQAEHLAINVTQTGTLNIRTRFAHADGSSRAINYLDGMPAIHPETWLILSRSLVRLAPTRRAQAM
ncbi:MAG: hypothetical protein Q4G22_09935 [Paracoccus sp. (in: a-proteobacteria)]|uniref:hypothetical protein n=1 Tax=Paracoccus sp. TaxID=267 RepID=UPI0026E041F9|nr:hypothetical protein [Paracoccus sp. (in: a-proteobacteria)]MDO5632145.1 hypothetical protein [Paracoccus sp. (in: a-proteobacteria)]